MPLPNDFQTTTQRIDPDRSIRALLPPNVGDLLAFAVQVAFIAALILLPPFL